MNIMTVDPGKMTGWAMYTTEVDSFSSGQAPWFEHLQWFEDVYRAFDVVVCESFVITAATIKKSRQNWSLEAIGTMKYLLAKQGRELVLQSPGEAKGFATPEKLKKVGWWLPGKDHAQDAARHMLTYVVRNSREIGFDLNRLV